MENEKDALFYKDLIYEIKKYAKIYVKIDDEAEERIKQRQKYDTEMNNEVMISLIPEFNLELYAIVNRIMMLANGSFKSLNEIANYPELVEKEISKLEAKIDVINNSHNINTKVKVLKNKKPIF